MHVRLDREFVDGSICLVSRKDCHMPKRRPWSKLMWKFDSNMQAVDDSALFVMFRQEL